MNDNTRYNEAKKATLISALINSLLGALKIIIGLIGHSQALITDGVHSFSDLLSDAFVLIAAKAGNKMPDEDHPYGHQRIETLGVIVIALLLMGVGAALAYNTIRLLWHHDALPTPSVYTLIVAAVSIAANEWLYRYTLKVADRINSNLLRSNAWHNRSDALTSIIVLIAVLGQIVGIPYLDSIGAIIISAFIIKMGLKMAWQSIQELIDTAVDPETFQFINDTIRRVPGVVDVHQLRTRMLGSQIYVDVHILVEPYISVSEGHYISDQVYVVLHKANKNITDVTVHIDPEDDEKAKPSLHLPSRNQIIKWLDQHADELPGFKERLDLKLHYIDGKLSIEVVLPKKYSGNAKIEEQYQAVSQNNEHIASMRIWFSN